MADVADAAAAAVVVAAARAAAAAASAAATTAAAAAPAAVVCVERVQMCWPEVNDMSTAFRSRLTVTPFSNSTLVSPTRPIACCAAHCLCGSATTPYDEGVLIFHPVLLPRALSLRACVAGPAACQWNAYAPPLPAWPPLAPPPPPFFPHAPRPGTTATSASSPQLGPVVVLVPSD